MLALAIHFPTAHHHPADQAAQLAPWPPSPWHVLATIAQVWQAGLARHHDVPREAMAALVDALAAHLPIIALPRGARTTTQGIALAEETTVYLVWRDLDPTTEHVSHLREVTQHIHWLSRPENWVNLDVLTAPDAIPRDRWLLPTASPPHPDQTSQLLLPLSPTAWTTWRDAWRTARYAALLESLGHRAAIFPMPDPATLAATTLRALDAECPRDLLAALLAPPTGHATPPPGAQAVPFVLRDHDALQPVQRRAPAPATDHDRPTIARFRLAAEHLPRLPLTLTLTEAVHRRLVHLTDGHPLFSGRDPDTQQPLAGNAHCHILPEALGSDDAITHLTLFAAAGFDADVIAQLASPSFLTRYDVFGVQLVLLGVGLPADFAGLRRLAGQSPTLLTARTWRSLTPFVSTLFPKHTRAGAPKLDEHGIHKGSPLHDLYRQLEARGLPRPTHVKPLHATRLGARDVPWRDFLTDRPSQRGGTRGVHHGTGFELTFERPVEGPIALGYGAHLGLGVFVGVT